MASACSLGPTFKPAAAIRLPLKRGSSQINAFQKKFVPLLKNNCLVSEKKAAPFRILAKSSKESEQTSSPSFNLEIVAEKVSQVSQTILEVAEKGLKELTKPAVVTALIFAVLLSVPEFALAARSGGRVGGSNFSSRSYSAPPSRSYSAPSYGSPSYSAPFFAPSPFYGFSPFSFGPTVVVGGGGGFGGILSFLFFGALIFFVFNSVTGFLSSNDDDLYMTETSTVIRLQIGLLGIARSLQKDLDRIAARADTSTEEGLYYVLTETSLALMRHPNYCAYGFASSDVKKSIEETESAFNRLSLEERGKLKEETLVNVGNIRRNASGPTSADRIGSEFIVVTIIAAAEGKVKLPQINNTSDLKEALTILGSIPSDQLQAVEILWTPQDENDSLTAQEMLMDYPSLRSL